MTGLGGLLERYRTARPAARAGVAGVVAILLLAAGLAVAARNHPRAPDSQAEVDRVGERLDAANPWEARAKSRDDGTVRVREWGFARLSEPEVRGKIGYAVSVVVENTSRVDAVVPRLDFDVRDEAGRPAELNDVNDGVTDQVIPPGVRLGITGTIHLDEPVAEEVSVSPGVSDWYPAREDIGEVEAVDVRVREDDDSLRVGLESSYDMTLLAPTFQALFRDEAGNLVGGTRLFSSDFNATVPPGSSRHDFALETWPEDADPDAIEVYVLYDWTVFGF
ncbi:hypothetical protein [Stackebrandtia nassauensis]|uniref:Uncharacterized protein n=1 Tax=Stackebrandtia nassauensis (strain DSM 44728 / CIP 108903 / NRRL B-16338 / NBRC 102104 / LLR-40K-21) TaxID=446470 RepID=D3PZK6_STANL|nr:hypothetical protein [Stackebrandtia nassauensis]ADD41680.1 hypothetical protein Snas_1984 [Stackebrandtia nassauensis DSM 44728]